MLIAIICLFTGFTLGFFTAALCQAASHSDSAERTTNEKTTGSAPTAGNRWKHNATWTIPPNVSHGQSAASTRNTSTRADT